MSGREKATAFSIFCFSGFGPRDHSQSVRLALPQFLRQRMVHLDVCLWSYYNLRCLEGIWKPGRLRVQPIHARAEMKVRRGDEALPTVRLDVSRRVLID